MFVGSRIRELRKEKGLTQEELGKLINVTKVSISCYENGTRIPNLETFIDLLEVLDTTPDYLLGRDSKVVAEEDEEYSVVLPKIDIQVIKALQKDENLINFLRKDPKRSVEYLSKKAK